MLGLLYGGTPTSKQDAAHALHHLRARQQVAEVSLTLTLALTTLEAGARDPNPKHTRG